MLGETFYRNHFLISIFKSHNFSLIASYACECSKVDEQVFVCVFSAWQMLKKFSLFDGALQPKIRFYFIHHVSKLLMNTPTTHCTFGERVFDSKTVQIEQKSKEKWGWAAAHWQKALATSNIPMSARSICNMHSPKSVIKALYATQ